MTSRGTPAADIPVNAIRKNPNNPRRYFNDEKLDLLRTSVQEVGILVPVIAYQDPEAEDQYVLMDGERRWICAVELGLSTVPSSLIDAPSALDNLLRMFNIHAVREDWPLISIALSLKEVMEQSGESRESRLAQMTGLTRSAVRRAKRLLSLPAEELDLISAEAHLERAAQIHREDLYLEIEAAESVLRNELPEIGDAYDKPRIIRQFARKRETGNLAAITNFRDVGRLAKAAENDLVDRAVVVDAARRLVEDETADPSDVFREVAAAAYEQQALGRKSLLVAEGLAEIPDGAQLSEELREALRRLRREVDRLLSSDT